MFVSKNGQKLGINHHAYPVNGIKKFIIIVNFIQKQILYKHTILNVYSIYLIIPI